MGYKSENDREGAFTFHYILWLVINSLLPLATSLLSKMVMTKSSESLSVGMKAPDFEVRMCVLSNQKLTPKV
jgi:hypothetical protein